jgi:hypothetical protein
MFHAVIYALLSLAYLVHARPELFHPWVHAAAPWIPIAAYGALAALAVRWRRRRHRQRVGD